jgi:hypothetical protein
MTAIDKPPSGPIFGIGAFAVARSPKRATVRGERAKGADAVVGKVTTA